MPLAGGFAESAGAAAAAPTYPMEGYWCPSCGLVNVGEDVADDILFEHYRYASSDVPGLVRHFDGYAAFLRERLGDGPLRIVEIGCNDGVLLRRLPDAWERIGVDPSDVARSADTDGYQLVPEPFSSDVAGAIGRADVVTSSNALAHFTAIGDAWDGIAALHPREVWIEVHDLLATLESGQWDTVYHEHKVEWSAAALARAGAVRGLEAFAVERLPLHGGLLRMDSVPAARRRRLRCDRTSRLACASYAGRRETPAYLAVQEAPWAIPHGRRGARRSADQVPEMKLRAVVDGSPHRIGLWVPGRALEIVPPDAFDREPPPVTLVTAWNHAADIRKQHPEYKGRWLTAFG
jgi:D-mycarose 3-C-methyltransferase